MSNTPQIRFAGFTDAWEQRKLGEVFTEYSEKNHEELSPLTIIQGKGTILREESNRNLIYDKAGLKNYKLVNEGDFILHLRSFEGGLEMANSRGIVSPAYHIFHGENADSRFYYPFFRSKYFISVLLKPHVYGIRDGKSIDVEGMKLIRIPCPKIEEQQLIGDYFETLDNLITLHQRKCDALQKFKKSMLQKMFPQNGESVPEIRFAGFTDAWEQRKVGELTVESSEYTTLEAGFPLLTSSRNGLMYQNEYRGKQTTDSTETMFSIVPLGACTYRHMSDDDVFHLNVNRLEKGLVSREYPVFYASDDNNLDFIVQQINSSAEFRSFCAEQKNGGTRTRLYYKNLCEFQMLIPNTEEQEKIATFLLTLDTLITLHQRKLETLQKMKKSLLQKMFV